MCEKIWSSHNHNIMRAYVIFIENSNKFHWTQLRQLRSNMLNWCSRCSKIIAIINISNSEPKYFYSLNMIPFMFQNTFLCFSCKKQMVSWWMNIERKRKFWSLCHKLLHVIHIIYSYPFKSRDSRIMIPFKGD